MPDVIKGHTAIQSVESIDCLMQVKEAMLRSANESIAELQAALEAAQQDASHAAAAAGRAEKEIQARQAEAAQRHRSHRSSHPSCVVYTYIYKAFGSMLDFGCRRVAQIKYKG